LDGGKVKIVESERGRPQRVVKRDESRKDMIACDFIAKIE
jgi:hypothetical protein